jgi:flavin-dependent dehydrogenase
MHYKNILFVGDAVVGTFLLTGQGIYRALISGDVAGRCIANGYTKHYSHIMTNYFIKWDIIGTTLTRMNYVLRVINPRSVLLCLNSFSGFAKRVF